ncbi:MAG: magnesium transporter [Candidatus Saccharibacteria bacterium]|nr:magnesium transporter [Candidatus Saccharibacteria bacterium]
MPKSHTKTHEHVHEVRELIHAGQISNLRTYLKRLHTQTVVEIIDELSDAQSTLVFRLLPRTLASKVFRRLEFHQEEQLLKGLSKEETAKLLHSLKPDERVNLIEEMPAKVTRRMLNMLEPEDRAEAVKLLGYPEDSIGRLMTPDFVAVKDSWTVEKALEHMRDRAKESETINVVYVVDKTWKLSGFIELNRLILAESDQGVTSIMDDRVISLSAYDDREHAVRLMNSHKLSVIPIVDSGDTLIGIVTFDDVIEVAQEETTEDFHKTSAIANLDVSYQKAGVWRLVHRRAGWLIGLVVINLASSGVIAAYEETLAAALALAFFIPLLIDSGGNAGAQSATLMIRAISTGEVRLSQWFKTIYKEMAVGISLAIVLGIASAGVGMIRGGPVIGLIVGLSMAVIVVLTNLLGSLLPFLLSRLKIDPAVASGPLITSVADVMGLVIYFSIATALLGQLA